MLPVLLSLGPVKLYSYGFMMFLGLFFGLYWWWKMGRDEHLEEKELFDMFFVGVFVYYVFARLGYVVIRGGLDSWVQIVAVWAYPGLLGGFGVLGVSLFVWLAARKREWKVWKVLDMLAVLLSFVSVFVGLGGFLNGANPGVESDWFGVKYPGKESRVFPVDLLEVLFWSLGVFLISKVRKNFRFYDWYKAEKSKIHEGLAFLTFVILNGGCLFIKSFVDKGFLGMKDGKILTRVLGILGVLGGVVFAYVFSGREFKEDFEFLKGFSLKQYMISLRRKIKKTNRRKK